MDGLTGGRAHGRGGWANGAKREADGARTRRTSGELGRRGDDTTDLKGAYTLLPTSFTCARTTCLTVEQVYKVLGSALGSELGLRICFARNNIFAIQAQHYCEVYARIVLALFKTIIRIQNLINCG